MKTNKCLKKGHKPIRQVRRGIRKDESYIGVAKDVTEERIICKRCKAILTEPVEIYSRRLTSLQMGNRQWERLETRGVVWHNGWKREDEDNETS